MAGLAVRGCKLCYLSLMPEMGSAFLCAVLEHISPASERACVPAANEKCWKWGPKR